jgi:hypothetical protein
VRVSTPVSRSTKMRGARPPLAPAAACRPHRPHRPAPLPACGVIFTPAQCRRDRAAPTAACARVHTPRRAQAPPARARACAPATRRTPITPLLCTDAARCGWCGASREAPPHRLARCTMAARAPCHSASGRGRTRMKATPHQRNPRCPGRSASGLLLFGAPFAPPPTAEACIRWSR